jgi:heat shock protein HslJ
MRRLALLAALAVLAGCALPEADPPLAGTRWELVELRPARVEIGGLRVPDPARYTLAFEAGGMVRARLDCNRGQGGWDGTAEASDRGSLRLGPMAVTRALCPADGIGTRLEQALPAVRRYELAGTELRLLAAGDGPGLIWRRVAP